MKVQDNLEWLTPAQHSAKHARLGELSPFDTSGNEAPPASQKEWDRLKKDVVTPFRRPIDSLRADQIVDIMASHLVAAILADGLDTSNDIDVISCLINTPDRFHHRIVLDHMDRALDEAKQILIAKEMGED